MAYLGQAPINGFHAKQQLTGDGSTVTYTLDQTVATETSIIVSVGGVLQEPSVAYDLAEGGTKITFTEAPASTDRVYIHFLGKAIVQNLLDAGGAELILDADNDTSLTADTDDEIDIKVGGSDISTIKSTGYHNLDSIKFVAGTGDDMQMYHDGSNSYLTNSTGALKLATETSGIAVTIGHSTSEVTIADNATVTGDLTVTGTLTQTGTQTFDGGIDVDNFNINGTTIALSSGDMLLDSAGDIILDADGADITLKDGGTPFGVLTNSSTDFVIKSHAQDKDLIFKGNDGGSEITALTLDMSAAGAATFNSTVTANAGVVVDDITIDGTEIDLSSGNLTIDVAGNITIDADGGTITFADAGSSLGTITSSGYSGTAAVASVATTVTITDNENTDENNAVIFAAGGDVDGGNLGLESDGDLTYNPSSGTLNVPNISVTGTQTIVNSVTMNANNAVIFEGATADAHETTLSTVDATGDRTINLPNVSGTLPVLAAASATQITSTPEELNLIDGGTARGTTALASGDGILINDGGTMRMTNVDTVRTYMEVDSLQLAGGTMTGDLNLGDNVDINIGDGTDLKIYHDGSNSYIEETGTGSLRVLSSYFNVRNPANNESMIAAAENGAVELFHDDSKKFETTAAGATVTGVLTADSGVEIDNITIDGTEIDLSSGSLTIDVAADIILDADGGTILFHDGGTHFGEVGNSSSDLVIKSAVSDKDILIKGKDGGSTITACTFDMSAAGAATFNNDVTAFSDARLKENVETIDNALDKVCAMRGVTFNRIDNENGGRQMGVIAQEVQDIVPEVVKVNDDEDNTLSVSYGNLVGVLIESIKELKAEIDELKGN